MADGWILALFGLAAVANAWALIRIRSRLIAAEQAAKAREERTIAALRGINRNLERVLPPSERVRVH